MQPSQILATERAVIALCNDDLDFNLTSGDIEQDAKVFISENLTKSAFELFAEAPRQKRDKKIF